MVKGFSRRGYNYAKYSRFRYIGYISLNGLKIKSPEITQEERDQYLCPQNSEANPYGEFKDISVQRDKLIDEKLADSKANRELRDKYSLKAYRVVKKSLWGWAALLFIYGSIKVLTFLFTKENKAFEVFSDNVLIAITTATSLNIFAAFLSLIRGLFPPSLENKK